LRTLNKGTFRILEVDRPTVNKRIYPRALVEKFIEQVRERLENRALLGHRYDTVFVERHLLADASHLTTDLRIEDNWLVADIEILDNAEGLTLQKLLEKNAVKFTTLVCGCYASDTGVVSDDTVLERVDYVEEKQS